MDQGQPTKTNSYTVATIKTVPASCHCGGDTAFVLDFGAISYMIGCACHTWLDLSTMTFVKRFDQPELAGSKLELRHFYSEQTEVNVTAVNQKQTQTKDLLTCQKCGSTVICGFVNRDDYSDKSFVQTKNGEWRRRYTVDIVTPPKFAKLQCDDCDSELTVQEG